jgi:hypothetical protein
MNDYFNFATFGIAVYGAFCFILSLIVVSHMNKNGIKYLLGFGPYAWFISIIIGGIFGFGIYLYWFYILHENDREKND